MEFGDWSLDLIPGDTSSLKGIDSTHAFKILLSDLPSSKLVFLLCDSSALTILRFFQLFEARVPVALIDANITPERLGALVHSYQPDLIIGLSERLLPPELNYLPTPINGVWNVSKPNGGEIHPDLAVLLSTSGSTGSQKFVRLSRSNILRNAEQIAQSLNIAAGNRAITTLPFHYSFGMSVATSHAARGAALVVTDKSIITPDFWEIMNSQNVTFLVGVPQTFTMFKRLDFESKDLTSLEVLAQAGGKLSDALITYFHDSMIKRGGNFHVMYGQTEASPRISCLPSADIPSKLGSVGLPVAGGSLQVLDAEGTELGPRSVGEIQYEGPNVMMGYTESRVDLHQGDLHNSVLKTGDLGYLDEDGYLFLVGRSKRIAKIAGSRVSLDEIESLLQSIVDGPFAAVSSLEFDDITAFSSEVATEEVASIRQKLARMLGVPPKLINLRKVEAIPYLSNGKIDYSLLEDWARER